MALPPAITPKTVTIGIASFFDGTLAEGTATITAPVNVIHTPTNRPIFSSAMSKRFADGETSFDLCPTDADGLNNKSWTYKLNVTIQGAIKQPDPIYFTLPTAGPDMVDLDGLVTVPSSAGTPISVDVLTTTDLEPYALAPTTDTEREDFVPSRLDDTALRAAFVPAADVRRGLLDPITSARRGVGPRKIMATSPTVTVGAADASPTVGGKLVDSSTLPTGSRPSSKIEDSTSGPFRYSGSDVYYGVSRQHEQ